MKSRLFKAGLVASLAGALICTGMVAGAVAGTKKHNEPERSEAP